MKNFEAFADGKAVIAVVGLGYVGLPLAHALSQHFSVLGFDISYSRIRELQSGHDRTGEVDSAALATCKILYSSDPESLKQASLVIVAVPTPIDDHRNPDLRPIVGATEMVARQLSPGTTVVYESTVYPGLTEEVCLPLLQRHSGLIFGEEFTIGYSPERINPGDRTHTLSTIVKVVSGSDARTADLLEQIYGAVVEAGVYRAPSIKVAEAAKVIENTQRDINIALMNELSLIFSRLGIDTLEVLKAAGTKWNFLPFRPGLVGGHCIGVDPYYLTFKAESVGYHPEVILAGRRINDAMGAHVAMAAVKRIIKAGCQVQTSRVGVLGLTFKEDVPDLRNTRVVDIVRELHEYCGTVLIHDPLADPAESVHEYGLTLSPLEDFRELDAVILAVPHAAYRELSFADIRTWYRNSHSPFLDVKGFASPAEARCAGLDYWRL